MPDAGIREALEKLWSASAFMGTSTTEEKLRATAEALGCGEGTSRAEGYGGACCIGLPAAVKNLNDKAFMIVVQDFQDPYTLNVKQLMKCCVEEITPDGRLIPFCAYNSVGYREQVRAQMSGVPVVDVVPNALPLADRLTTTPHGSKAVRTEVGEGA
ncbi:hypothetical protein QFZ82_007431 [Streptomyces sp. V4I23]|uniref:hypothetical protein n=1 Tax=Streptomyces sp. V4I23 TaxID=3042282 RepID=UPI002786DA2C|nr:hypothetical protein [Streptomyces sp. V4I23]MDQ1012946.1 hypothetical protein [Streptomyces sp. V4I23]